MMVYLQADCRFSGQEALQVSFVEDPPPAEVETQVVWAAQLEWFQRQQQEAAPVLAPLFVSLPPPPVVCVFALSG